jgi:hypothetical protein
MTEPEETYGDDRARALQALLRSLAARIVDLDTRGELLAHAGELMKLIGDIRSELFHYEVRATYDTPEVADSRRIVSESKATEPHWERTTWQPDEKREKESDREW